MIQYTYESAATQLHPNKVGVNRITWEDRGSVDQNNWTELTREYFPVDPRTETGSAMKAWIAATPEEKQIMANDLKNYLQ